MDTNPYQQPTADLVVDPDHLAFEVQPAQRRPVGAGWRWLADAFSLFTPSWGQWILALIVFWLVSVVVQLIPVVGSVAGMLIGPVLTAGFLYMARQADIGEPVQVGDVFIGFKVRTGALILLAVAIGLAYLLFFALAGAVFWAVAGSEALTLFDMVAAAEAGDVAPSVASQQMPLLAALFALLVVGFLIPAVMMYWFAVPLVFFSEMGPLSAMQQSFVGCLKNILPMFWFSLLAMVLFLVAMIPLGLGLFVMAPVMLITLYTSFRDIFVNQS